MRRKIAFASAAAVAVAAGTTGLVIWLSQPSYDDVVNGCVAALKEQAKAGNQGKPDACKDVKEDDYTALVVSNAINGLPQTDKDLLDYYDDGDMNGSVGDG
ncbi:hypothetical protein ACIBL8_39015 [Streptomyces sp. NPDC050523]|uniref:hypothetical protein n=1 Tax=Streptomyces sp. NPDC050523 TaxID=3365622 RepID=UPI0037A0B19E